ncbi:MAG: hypothetical protein WDZ51_17655 [Pirellulaceae bacterium]
MTWLFDQPLPILIVGVLGGAILAGTLAQTGNRLFLKLLLAWITLFGLLLVVEYGVITDREQVQATVYEIAAALEANDTARVQRSISDDAADLQREVEQKLNYVHVEAVKIKRNMEVNFVEQVTPRVAVAKMNVVFIGNLKSGITSEGRFPTYLILTFQQEADQAWRLADYQFFDARGEQAGEIRPPA